MGQELIEGSANAIESITRSEIDMQIATAKRYRRDPGQFLSKMTQIALSATDVAESCYYVLERRDRDGATKAIEGPSIRLAEIASIAWGNLRCGARVLSEEGNFIRAQGVAHDLENNLFVTKEVLRRITTRHGQRYSDDMVAVNANAACSIAVRNAILAVVPRQAVESVVEQCKALVAKAMAKDPDLEKHLTAAVKWFGKRGVTEAQILGMFGRAGKAEMTADDLTNLRGIRNAIEDGATTVEEAFGMKDKPDDEKPKASAAAKAAATLQKKRDAKVEREPGAEG